MEKLSIVMPFLNEGEEPYRTVESIHETAPEGSFEIVAVEDKADPSAIIAAPYDFSRWPAVKHVPPRDVRLGVDGSRSMGVLHASHPTVVLIDAHMRFRKDGWLPRLVDAVRSKPDCMFCTACGAMGHGVDRVEDIVTVYRGATLMLANDFSDAAFVMPDGSKKVAREVFEPKWLRENPGTEPTQEIPCILGAVYAFDRQHFINIRGLNGLTGWGSSEPCLSLKTWLAGGTSYLLNDLIVGHVFRDNSPYATAVWHLVFNKLLLLRTLMPKWSWLETMLPPDMVAVANAEYGNRWGVHVRADILHYRSIFKRTPESFLQRWGIAEG